MVEGWQSLGLDVKLVTFPDSKHVQHLGKHPDRYALVPLEESYPKRYILSKPEGLTLSDDALSISISHRK